MIESIKEVGAGTLLELMDGGKTLLFNLKGADKRVWIARRDSTDEKFGKPEPLGELPGGVIPIGWTMSSDKNRIIIAQGTWNAGGMELWESRRIERR